jgi:hypothetical protein
VLVRLPGAPHVANSPCSMRSRSAWIASPCSVSPATIIFSPLYSGGLWLPVISTPEPVPRCWVAKYSNGVGTMPISTTSMPVDTQSGDQRVAQPGAG